MKDDAEYYFIQFWFCKNRDILRQDNRLLYDVLLKRYQKVYENGRNNKADIQTINDVFQAKLFQKT